MLVGCEKEKLCIFTDSLYIVKGSNLHFVLDDLPTSTKAPELDDRNTRRLMLEEGEGGGAKSVDDELMGKYLGWLVGAGFLPRPVSEKGLAVMSGVRASGRSGS